MAISGSVCGKLGIVVRFVRYCRDGWFEGGSKEVAGNCDDLKLGLTLVCGLTFQVERLNVEGDVRIVKRVTELRRQVL